MPIYLDELMVGEDPNEIIYPNLLLCMGITALMSDGSLIGAHVVDGTREQEVLTEMANRIALAAPETPVHLYCTGNYENHKHHGGMKVSQKAAALGFHGKAYRFNTPDYAYGTYVRIVSNGANHKCSIDYKRDQNQGALYQNGQGPLVGQWSEFHQGIRVKPSAKVGLAAPIHKPHQVNFSRLLSEVKRYDIP